MILRLSVQVLFTSTASISLYILSSAILLCCKAPWNHVEAKSTLVEALFSCDFMLPVTFRRPVSCQVCSGRCVSSRALHDMTWVLAVYAALLSSLYFLKFVALNKSCRLFVRSSRLSRQVISISFPLRLLTLLCCASWTGKGWHI